MAFSKTDKAYIRKQVALARSESNKKFANLESKLEAHHRKTDILLEDMRSNLIKALGEGYDALRDKTQNNEKRIKKLEQQI